jgi:hypothetical protein
MLGMFKAKPRPVTSGSEADRAEQKPSRGDEP